MNIAIYTRRSYYSDASESVTMQADTCRGYIERMGWDSSCVTVYEDNGFVRSEIDRPAMNRLRQDIADGLIECVMVYRIDRITSRMNDFCNFYASLKDRGIKFVTVKDGIDTTTPIGEAMMYLAVIFSGIEVEQDTLRITDNMRHLASSGYWCGGRPPLGYAIQEIRVGKTTHKILVRDEEGIAFKRVIINALLDNDFSLNQVERWCRDQGIKAPGGGIMSSTQIHQILKAPQCVAATEKMYDYFEEKGCIMDPGSPREQWDGSRAIMVYGRTMENKQGHQLAPPEKWRVSLAKWEPYLSDDEYLAIMSHFGHKQICKALRYESPLLRGVLRCKCGRTMSVARKRNKHCVTTYYHCRIRDRYGKEACDSRAIKAADVDAAVLDIFRKISVDPKELEKYMERPKQKNPTHRVARTSLDQIERKIRNLTSALSENGDSAAAKYIVQQLEELDLKAAQLRREIQVAAVENRKAAAAEKSALAKRDEIVRLCQHIEELTPAEQNDIAKAVIKSAVWDNESVKIVL